MFNDVDAMSAQALPAGAGLTAHPALLGRILRAADNEGDAAPRFLEFVAEGLRTSAQKKEARALGEICPIAVHGVALGLGGVGIDRKRLDDLARVADAVGAVAVSEHLAFVRSDGIEIGHLMPLPFTWAAVDVVAENVGQARRLLPELWLENVWSPLHAACLPDEMEEPEFLQAVALATGCGLLLDAANLVANARNRGTSALLWLDRLPLHAVKEIHVAGSDVDAHGFVIDTHAHAITDEVFAFTAAVLARTGPLPVCLERDRNVDVDDVFAELQRLQRLVESAVVTRHAEPAAPVLRPAANPAVDAANTAALDHFQRGLARQLLGDDDDAASDVTGQSVRRARAILARKARESAAAQKRSAAARSRLDPRALFERLLRPSRSSTVVRNP